MTYGRGLGMSPSSPFFLLGLALLGWGAVGCKGGGNSETAPICRSTQDCPTGLSCVMVDGTGVCQFPFETQCGPNAPCTSPLVCASDGRCRASCNRASDCLADQVCVENTCSDSQDGRDGGITPGGDSKGRTTFSVSQSSQPALDILFVVDNSPSMDPKQRALATNFPALVNMLQYFQGGLPDLHIGVVSSDMGAGGGEAGGNCSSVLGNQGILWGNDQNVDPNDRNNKFATVKGIKNGCGMNSGARWIEDAPDVDGVNRKRNYTGSLADTFSCLATAVGVSGCGYEHQLQSLRLALNPMDGINPQNIGFLRRAADLVIVIVSDEDDCSADPNTQYNDGMFMPRTLGNTASLRCAARGHLCNGKAIPDYDPAAGYTSPNPFVARFADCEAKDSADPKELPLIRIRDMIDSVKQVKDRPSEQILVAGIIGWPSPLDGVQYRIDKDTTSMPVEQQKLWDYMPICKLPDQKSNDGNIYKAYGGFRLKKFIDGFGANGLVSSICDGNFAPAMKQIGHALANRARTGCVSYPLVDSDPTLPDAQPDCVVKEQMACPTPGSGGCPSSGFQEATLPQCMDVAGQPLSPRSPERAQVPEDRRPCWYLVYDTDQDFGCPEVFNGQRVLTLRQGDQTAPPGARLSLSCRTCETPTDPRCAVH